MKILIALVIVLLASVFLSTVHFSQHDHFVCGEVTSWRFASINRLVQVALVDTTGDRVPDVEAKATVSLVGRLIENGEQVDISIPRGYHRHMLIRDHLTSAPQIKPRER